MSYMINYLLLIILCVIYDTSNLPNTNLFNHADRISYTDGISATYVCAAARIAESLLSIAQ